MTKTWIAFIGGTAFGVAALITCGGQGPGGVGAATATAWEYAVVAPDYASAHVRLPGQLTSAEVTGCTVPADQASTSTSLSTSHCALNVLGPDRWELVAVLPFDTRGNPAALFLKRPKQ